MQLNFKNLLISLLSFLFLIVSFFYIYLILKDKNLNPIQFKSDELSPTFEGDISKNIDNIINYLDNFKFIKYYVVKKNDSQITIEINLEKTFARNNIKQEIIFKNNSYAPFSFFNQSFIESVELIDISQDSLKINDYLQTNFDDLKKIFKIKQIEFIDERRYDLILDNNIRIMLPKIIDIKLLSFVKKNFDLLKVNTDFKEYLDFRNFNEKTIRLK